MSRTLKVNHSINDCDDFDELTLYENNKIDFNFYIDVNNHYLVELEEDDILLDNLSGLMYYYQAVELLNEVKLIRSNLINIYYTIFEEDNSIIELIDNIKNYNKNFDVESEEFRNLYLDYFNEETKYMFMVELLVSGCLINEMDYYSVMLVEVDLDIGKGNKLNAVYDFYNDKIVGIVKENKNYGNREKIKEMSLKDLRKKVMRVNDMEYYLARGINDYLLFKELDKRINKKIV